MPPKKSLKPALNESEPEIYDGPPPTLHPPTIEPRHRRASSKTKILKTSREKVLKRPVNEGDEAEAEVDHVGSETEEEPPSTPSKIKVLRKRISKKSIPRGDGMVEELPLKQRPSAVSLTKKKSATQKWTFRKSLASSPGDGTTPTGTGIKGKRSLSSPTGIIKKKSLKPGTNPPSEESLKKKMSSDILKARSQIKIFKKSSQKSITKEGELLLKLGVPPPIGFTERLFMTFKYRGGRVSDVTEAGVVRAAPVWNKKRIMVTLLILLILLGLLTVIIVMFARRQGAGSNNTSTTTPVMTTGLPTTTDKCGDIPPKNQSGLVGEYCKCKTNGVECGSCCAAYGLRDGFVVCFTICDPIAG